MNKPLIYIALFFFILPFYFLGADEVRAKTKFILPATNFITPGFKISLAGSPNASQTHSPGERHSFSPSLFNLAAKYSLNGMLYNTDGGQINRDNILNYNIEDYSYYNQPFEKISPLGKVNISYTTKSAEWTFDISLRGKNYSGSYALGNNLPFEYFPGTMQYNWSEGQYNIIRNHALYNFFMIQPLLGIREIREDYSRKSNVEAYPLFKNYSSVTEKSISFSHQAGLIFHFKIIDNLRIKFTGKIFWALNGNLKSERNHFIYDGNNLSMLNSQFKANKVNVNGNELEGEVSYGIKNFNFFIGYNLTTYAREAKRDKNYYPTIVTNGNLEREYIKYFISNSLLESDSLGSSEYDNAPRFRTLKYLYLGISLNF